jgi:hypothetical protein
LLLVDDMDAGNASAYSSSQTAQSRRLVSSTMDATSVVSFAISAVVAALVYPPLKSEPFIETATRRLIWRGGGL